MIKMTDEDFKRILNITKSHVDFLEKNRENSAFSIKETDELVNRYNELIKEGESILEEEIEG